MSVAALAGAPGTAGAAGIRECGGYEPGRGFVRSPQGAGVYNITSRVVSCNTAKKIVLSFYENYTTYCGNSGRCYIRGWTCRTRSLGVEYQDTRCTRNRGRVVRFQHGA